MTRKRKRTKSATPETIDFVLRLVGTIIGIIASAMINKWFQPK